MSRTRLLNPDLETPTLSHGLPFDPTYGYRLPDLLQVAAPTAPPDFAEFWQSKYKTARAVEVSPRLLREDEGNDSTRVWELTYRSTDGVKIGGWLTLPRHGNARSAWVVGHGYGGREAPDLNPPMPNAAMLFFCARGLSLSRLPGVGAVSSEHVLHGIEHRDRYIHGGCVADLWCAVSALQSLVPACADRIGYWGGSFGGGIGALALPWEPRIRRAILEVPSFGNHPLRLTLTCTGSGQAVRTHVERHPKIAREVLPYFDAAIAARHITIPVLVHAALLDPAVPPPGQFSVFNALAGPRELLLQRCGHFDDPVDFGSAVRFRAAARNFAAHPEQSP